MSQKTSSRAFKGSRVHEKPDIKSRDRKPNYGHTALKYFLGIAVLGIIGLIVALVGLFTNWSLSWVLLLVGIPIAFVGLYIGGFYIPMYFLMLRPKPISNIWKQISESEFFRGNEYVLDVGCGTGRVSMNMAKLLKKGKVVGIDIFSGVSGNSPDPAYRNAEIEGVINRVEFKYGNVLEIPYPDNTFDIVTAGSVLHEIHKAEDKIKAIKEIIRVLKPGGKFITIELLRDARMFLAMLFFGFVWKPKNYWVDLMNKSDFKNLKTEEYTRFLNYAVFIAQKE